MSSGNASCGLLRIKCFLIFATRVAGSFVEARGTARTVSGTFLEARGTARTVAGSPSLAVTAALEGALTVAAAPVTVVGVLKGGVDSGKASCMVRSRGLYSPILSKYT